MSRSSIEEHRASLDPNNPRDFMDVYISELQKGTNTRFDQESMELTCFDLFKVSMCFTEQFMLDPISRQELTLQLVLSCGVYYTLLGTRYDSHMDC